MSKQINFRGNIASGSSHGPVNTPILLGVPVMGYLPIWSLLGLNATSLPPLMINLWDEKCPPYYRKADYIIGLAFRERDVGALSSLPIFKQPGHRTQNTFITRTKLGGMMIYLPLRALIFLR